MINISYIMMRLLRRFTPPAIAYRFLSNDYKAPDKFMFTGLKYLETLKAKNVTINNAIAIEVGPGSLSPAALSLLYAGAEKVLLQEPNLRPDKIEQMKPLIHEYWDFLKKNMPSMFHNNTLFNINTNLTDKISIQRVPADSTDCFSSSIDIILSNSVLEHIKNIPDVFQEEYRILKDNGAMLHFVDLRDHYFKYPFEMLTFSRFIWENILTSLKRGGGYQNRLRIDDYTRMAMEAGFRKVEISVLGRDNENFIKVRNKLHPDFKAHDDQNLNATLICLFAVK